LRAIYSIVLKQENHTIMKISKKYLEKVIREETINTLASIRENDSEGHPIGGAEYRRHASDDVLDSFLAAAKGIIKSKGLDLKYAKRMSTAMPFHEADHTDIMHKARRSIAHLYGIIQSYLHANDPAAIAGKLAIDTVPALPKRWQGHRGPKEAFQISDMGLRSGFRLDIDDEPGLRPDAPRAKLIIVLYEVAKEIEAMASKMGSDEPGSDDDPSMPPATFFR